ncbi:type II toxin-antitoxin system toxin DNA ADP-ribosyl transferase DarT [Marinimicrobium sp. C2-29]|uniref:type II toxin-antitoxin system toxin DNA ADP-ribosyl transferase DarT n=1 Tax=Marinimicrobium sp. C2-29 TaxID=3139825 RepID=UPI003138B22D
MAVPEKPKIYHIVHVDRLPSILAQGCLWSDAAVAAQPMPGTTIGMSGIKDRRLNELSLDGHQGLYVGQCVPFYFCPRSVMLYLINKSNHPELIYRGGQEPIIHLEADLHDTVTWAEQNARRWAFTLSNAGSRYFEDRTSLAQLNELDWTSIQAREWQACKEAKQAEFLLEASFPWELVERVGVYSERAYQRAKDALAAVGARSHVEIIKEWYY